MVILCSYVAICDIDSVGIRCLRLIVVFVGNGGGNS